MENVMTNPPKGPVPPAPVAAGSPGQYVSAQSLATVAGATAVLTMVYGIFTNLYANATGKDLASMWCHLIVLALAVLVVIAFNAKREQGTTWTQHILILVVNTAVLYTAVAGATGITANLSDKKKAGNVPTPQQKNASFLSILWPERPLYGVSATEHSDVVQDLESEKRLTDVVEQYQALHRDSTFEAFLQVNKVGVQNIPGAQPTSFVIPASNEQPDGNSSTWVYFGQIINGAWATRNFEFSGTPAPGMELKASGDVFERNALPKKINEDLWKLGDVEGTVKKGAEVKVLQVIRIEDDNYWLQIAKND